MMRYSTRQWTQSSKLRVPEKSVTAKYLCKTSNKLSVFALAKPDLMLFNY